VPTSTSAPGQRATRHLEGRTERDLLALPAGVRLHRFRPAGILRRDTGWPVETLFSPISVRVDVLAEAMVRTVLDPAAAGPGPVISHAAVERLGARPRGMPAGARGN
jgi:hypothetical protein